MVRNLSRMEWLLVGLVLTLMAFIVVTFAQMAREGDVLAAILMGVPEIELAVILGLFWENHS